MKQPSRHPERNTEQALARRSNILRERSELKGVSRRTICLLTLSLLALTCNPIDRTWSAQCKNCFEIPGRTRNLKKCLTKELVKTKNLINTVDACDQSITISEPTTTINKPGVYCLIADISGSIEIDADNVTLNLNNHTITSNAPGQKVIEVLAGQNGHSNITIKNGIVKVQDGGTSPNNRTVGLLVNNCTNLKITDVSFEETITSLFTSGCQISTAKGIRIDRCSFTGFTFGLRFDGSSNGKITCCTIHDNGNNGCIISNSSNLVFEQVEAANNGALGFFISSSSNCNFLQCRANNNNGNNGHEFASSSDCLCFECEANQNDFEGFVAVSNSKKIIFDSCRAMNNSLDGFRLNNSQKCCIKNCLAKGNNGDGFLLFNNSSDNYITNNKSIGNGTGFKLNVTTGTNNVFLSNYAEGNSGGNYSGVTPIKTYTMSTGLFPATPSAWDNISATP